MGSGHALLAPVPALHIDSALDRCADLGAVAFGTRNYDTFVNKKERGLVPGDPVFVYVSHGEGNWDREVSLEASFVTYVEGDSQFSWQLDLGEDRRVPAGIAPYRPETCLRDGEDEQPLNERPLGWWVVSALRPADDRRTVGSFVSVDGGPLFQQDPHGVHPVPRYPLVVNDTR